MPTCLRVLIAAALPVVLAAEDLKLPIAADNSISMHPSEMKLNAGKSVQVKAKGIENVILLDFESAQLKGKTVDKAVLHLRGTDDKLMLRKVGLSTVATPWNEGVGDGEEGSPVVVGDSCYLAAVCGDQRSPGRAWGDLNMCFLDVVFGRGGTIWTEAYVAEPKDRWYEIPVDGRLLEACACGLSNGLALSDDNGQCMNIKDPERKGNLDNNFFSSRERKGSEPWIEVSASPAKPAEAAALVVKVEPWAAGSDQKAGGIEVSWPGPGNEAERAAILGYRLFAVDAAGKRGELARWLCPAPPPVGERARALLHLTPPVGHLTFAVEVVGRGGGVIAAGSAAGACSPVRPLLQPLAIAELAAPAAGEPPAEGDGEVWAAPDLVKVNPITGNVFEDGSYEGEPSGTASRANPVWSASTRTVTLAGLRNEWVAFQIVCSSKKPDLGWKITPNALTGPDGASVPAPRLSRLWYLKSGGDRGWYADPMLPLAAGEAFHVPDARNAVPNQANQTVYAEIYVPKTAKPGAYRGTVDVAVGDAKPIQLTVELTVAAQAVPDDAAFVWSMNAYSSPGADYGKADSDTFLAAERSFYTMAHEHRTCLAVLGYSHSAHFQDGVAPPLAGHGKDMHVADWSAWDKRYAPLFDGSAFKGTPREGQGLDHFYLPFMESWPTPIVQAYKWNDALWEDHWKVAGPIEEGFSQEAHEQWVAVMKDFIKHIADKGWKTRFQIYLNDKYFYKQYDPANKTPDHRGQGTSFWLLDEPQQIDDFIALALFGAWTREAQQGDRQRVVFRCDISRPQFSRDLLDRVVDWDVSGGFDGFPYLLHGWREHFGQHFWTYGGPPGVESSALGIEAQGLDLYQRGVEGFVPWMVLGGEGSWQKPDPTCVIYTGKPVGIDGACASLRLKAYRRAEQDVEYARLVGEHLGLMADDDAHRQLAQLLLGAVAATTKQQQLDAQGAQFTSFTGLKSTDFERLRRSIAARLAGAAVVKEAAPVP